MSSHPAPIEPRAENEWTDPSSIGIYGMVQSSVTLLTPDTSIVIPAIF
jgi:hypothetical protein